MNILRSILRQLASNGFRLAILLLAIVSVALALFGSPQTVKKILGDSGVYNSLTNTVVAHLNDAQDDQKHQTTQDQAEQALQKPEVQAAAKEAFNAQLLQNSSEQVIDGTYRWLDGTVPQPDFTIDLQPAVSAVENAAADSAVNKVKKLPVCTAQQVRALDIANIDIFSLPCLPPGIDLNAARQKYIDSFVSSTDNDFLKDPRLTADKLSKDANGQTPFDKANKLPQAYQWAQHSQPILAAVALVFAVGVIFLGKTRRLGFRSLGGSLLGVGITLLAIGLVANYLFDHYVNTTKTLDALKIANNGTDAAVSKMASAFEHIASQKLLLFGAIYVAAGILILLVTYWLKKRAHGQSKQGTMLDERGERRSNPDDDHLSALAKDDDESQTDTEETSVEEPKPEPEQQFTPIKTAPLLPKRRGRPPKIQG